MDERNSIVVTKRRKYKDKSCIVILYYQIYKYMYNFLGLFGYEYVDENLVK